MHLSHTPNDCILPTTVEVSNGSQQEDESAHTKVSYTNVSVDDSGHDGVVRFFVCFP